jgi:hypothetical protein
MTVQLFVGDDWSDIDRIVLALQKNADLPAGTFVFTQPTPPRVVRMDLPDPVDRTWRYKITRTDKNGDIHDQDWKTTDSTTLLVDGVDSDKLVVDVTPVGMEPPTAGTNLIEVQLQYIDAAHQIREIQTALIRALSDHYHWEVAIQDPQRRSYDYQVTVHRSNSDRILVIPIVKAA